MKRLSVRAVRFKNMPLRQAQITVFFSLLLPLFLALLGAALESAHQQGIRSKVQRSLVLCEYSFLSEYQKELWEQYGLFYVDTAYGGKEENHEMLESHLLKYLRGNLAFQKGEAGNVLAPFEVEVSGLKTAAFSRATDANGMGFYEQAVAYEQNLWGADLISEWLGYEANAKALEDRGAVYIESESQKRSNLDILKDRRMKEEEKGTEDPTITLQQEEASGLLAMVVSVSDGLSAKSISLNGIPSKRALLEGAGAAGRYPGGVINDQWFHTYLLSKCTNAKQIFKGEAKGGSWLSYEVEYILAGKDSDRENLESVVRRLLLLREGVNYVYLLTDEAKMQEAYALAVALVGVTMIPGLVEALQQVILLSWAYGESVLDVRGLLLGNQVAFEKSASTWKLPLSQLFSLKSHLAEYDRKTDVGGKSYEDYLRIFLTLMGRDEKCMRGLDVIEGNLRMTDGGRYIYMDQCIDGLTIELEFQAPYLFFNLLGSSNDQHVLSAERRFAYEW